MKIDYRGITQNGCIVPTIIDKFRTAHFSSKLVDLVECNIYCTAAKAGVAEIA